MKVRKRFLLALMASLVLHAGVLTGPFWPGPATDASPPPPLQARLVEAPQRAAPPARVPAPRPRKPRRPALVPALVPPPLAEPAEVLPPDPSPVQVADPFAAAEPPPAAIAGDAPAPPASAAALPLPRSVRIRYRVTLGEGGFGIGESVQELRHDGRRYEMRSSAETTGLAGFFRPVRVVNISLGEVTTGGLRPDEFRVERSNGKNEKAVFDWPAGLARLSNGREYPLAAGAQDMLSLFAQLALLPEGEEMASLLVVTGKKLDRYDFRVVGEETIATPGGARATLHLRGREGESGELTEVWLGLAEARLPVKIRHLDRRGQVYEQVAESIVFSGNTEGEH
jgi:hypothetical protein